jgi:hypothetical protein
MTNKFALQFIIVSLLIAAMITRDVICSGWQFISVIGKWCVLMRPRRETLSDSRREIGPNTENGKFS